MVPTPTLLLIVSLQINPPQIILSQRCHLLSVETPKETHVQGEHSNICHQRGLKITHLMSVEFPNKTICSESIEKITLYTLTCTHTHMHSSAKTWKRTYLSHCDHVPLTSTYTHRRTVPASMLGSQLAGLKAQLSQQQCLECSKVRMEYIYSGACSYVTRSWMAYC